MKTKIVIFDYDGTLTKSEKGTNTWFNMWKALDDLETDEKFYSMFKKGEINHRQWFNLIVDYLKNRKVDKYFFECLSKKIVLLNNIEMVFKTLYQQNIEIYILSSGIKNLIDLSLKDYKKYITEIQGYEMLFDSQGVVYAGKNVDFLDERKDDFIKKIIKSKDLKPKEILFIGNGANDECVSQVGIRTLCLNADNTNYQDNNVWNDYIFSDDLKDILPFINK